MDDPLGYGPSPKKARVEIIPLIDVVFFLLATFVLFTLALEKLSALQVTLPVSGPPNDGPDTILYIQASEPGTFVWREGREGAAEVVSREALLPKLEYYKRRSGAPRVMVQGDEKARFGAAIVILDELRKAHIEEVSIETVPPRS
jgi:biopolymer transport protein ExbD